MPQAMPGAMLSVGVEQTTQRNATDERNVRLQASPESSSVGDRRIPVNNPDSAMRFAEFIDDTQREYARSSAFRAALHSEEPHAPPVTVGICPPEHRHGETGTCYGHHGCRCGACRTENSRYQKRKRMQTAIAGWSRMTRKAI